MPAGGLRERIEQQRPITALRRAYALSRRIADQFCARASSLYSRKPRKKFGIAYAQRSADAQSCRAPVAQQSPTCARASVPRWTERTRTSMAIVGSGSSRRCDACDLAAPRLSTEASFRTTPRISNAPATSPQSPETAHLVRDRFHDQGAVGADDSFSDDSLARVGPDRCGGYDRVRVKGVAGVMATGRSHRDATMSWAGLAFERDGLGRLSRERLCGCKSGQLG